MFNSKTSVTKAARWLNGDDRRGVDIAPIVAPAQAGAAVGLRGVAVDIGQRPPPSRGRRAPYFTTGVSIGGCPFWLAA